MIPGSTRLSRAVVAGPVLPSPRLTQPARRLLPRSHSTTMSIAAVQIPRSFPRAPRLRPRLDSRRQPLRISGETSSGTTVVPSLDRGPKIPRLRVEIAPRREVVLETTWRRRGHDLNHVPGRPVARVVRAPEATASRAVSPSRGSPSPARTVA